MGQGKSAMSSARTALLRPNVLMTTAPNTCRRRTALTYRLAKEKRAMYVFGMLSPRADNRAISLL